MKKKYSKEEQEYHDLVAGTRDIVQTPQGQRLMWHIISMCGIYVDTFRGNSSTFYEEGKRAVGLEILEFLEDVDPTFYPRMLLKKAENFAKEEMNDGRGKS